MQPVEHVVDPEELSEYVDRELPAARAAEIEAHARTCLACQRVVADLRGVARDLGAWTVDDVPGRLRASDLFDRTQPRRRWFWIPSWVSVPAIGLAAVVLLVLATVPKRPPMMSVFAGRPAPSKPATAPGAAARSEGIEASVPAPEVPFGSAGKVRVGGNVSGQQAQSGQPLGGGPRIMRTASLRFVAADFDAARAAVDRIAAEAGGYVGTLNVSGARPSPRTLRAIVHVPADRVTAAVAAFRALGEIVEESQASQDMSEQLVDLEARLANGRNTEQRLQALLRTRTGRLSDVLEAEREVTRVRQEIEILDAQRKNIETRVSYGAITLQIDEEHKSSMSLGPLPLTVRLRNALVDGVRIAFEAAVATLLLVLQFAPIVLFWLLVVGVPVRFFLRRRARASA
jgi:uncharacterized protein DUF4349/putative zinc finger protein